MQFRSDGAVRIGLGGSGSADGAVDFTEPSGGYNGLSMAYDGDGNGIYAFGMLPVIGTRLAVRTQGFDNTTSALKIVDGNGDQLLRVRDDGTVIIGPRVNNVSLTGFNASLQVDGIIVTQEVAVRDAVWSDYVFEQDYDLMSIEDVQAYIEAHHHLPNIPTAEDVQRSGISIGRFQGQILAKVEELFLYVIQLSEQNANLKKQLEQIQENLQ